MFEIYFLFIYLILLFIIIIIIIIFFCRQHDTLQKKMSVAGYKEKVPERVHEENVAELQKLVNELSLVEEANKNLESMDGDGS